MEDVGDTRGSVRSVVKGAVAIVVLSCAAGAGCSSDSTARGANPDASTAAGGSGGTGSGGTTNRGGSGGTGPASGGAAPDASPAGGTDGSSRDAGTDASVTAPDGSDGSSGTLAEFASCAGLPTTCGAMGNEPCCSSPTVAGGTFNRSYDGVSTGYQSTSYPATISDFRLDAFEVTVGRFRKFVGAWNSGWRPVDGAGKHTHLNGGSGLTDSSGTTIYEPGWKSSWSTQVAPTDANLIQCNPSFTSTWTASPAGNEALPISCLNWFEAYAFCIWDGGFLPSEAEWNYAASGGVDQRVYPWSNPTTSTSIDCSYANYFDAAFCFAPPNGSQNRVGSESPKGDGKYLQSDLAGNVSEWVLDWFYSPYYSSTCLDCAYLENGTEPGASRVARGGSFVDQGVPYLLSSSRQALLPTGRASQYGVRCARTP